MRPVVVAAIPPLAILAAVAVAVAPGPSLAQGVESYDAVNVRLTRVVGEIEIQTGGVDRVTVEHDPGAGLLAAPRFDVEDEELEISQLPRRTDISCRSRGDRLELEVDRDGYHPIADYGRFVIRAPEGARVHIEGGAVTGTVGDVGELELGLASCGDVTVGDVAGDADVAVNGSGGAEVGAVGGELDVAVNGSGDVRVASVGGALDVAMNGSGDVVIGPVARGLDAAINGSGEVEIASVDGKIDAAIRGSGDVTIRGGRATSIDAAIMGSGDVRFDGVAETVDLSSFGSGDVYVAEVTGSVSSSAFGSGRVHVGRRD